MRLRRRARRRVRALRSNAVVGSGHTGGGPLSVIGRSVTRLLARCGIVTSVRDDPAADRLRGAVVVVAAGFTAVSPMLGVLVGVAGWHTPRLLAGRGARRSHRELDDELFLAVQLCMLSVHTGATVPQAVTAVSAHLPGRLGAALGRAVDQHRTGMLFDDALESVQAELGEPVAPLIGVLRAAHVDGDPVEPALVRLGDRLRSERRRTNEAEVRSLSVRLLIPLVCCSLPGFVLIAVVPLAIDAIGGLSR